MTQPKKEGPPRATLEQKIKILDYYHQSQRPQLETVDKFKNEVAISTLAFNEWVKHEDEYRARYRELLSEFQKNSRRKVKYKYDKINRAMDLLVQQRMERGEPVTEPVLREFWQVYAHQFGVDNPKRLIGFSHGWLNQFKKRHGLTKTKGPKDDATCVSNEKILAAKPEKQPAPFQPQNPLNFPGPYSKPEAGPAAAEIEKFIFSVADRFFHEHQYDYPQSVKTYHEFKLAFLSERLIDLRSKEPERPVDGRLIALGREAVRDTARGAMGETMDSSMSQREELRPPQYQGEHLEDIFSKRSYSGEWGDKSALRKIWEQNKVMLS